MAEGRQRENWSHTSWLLSMIRNQNVVKKSDLTTPDTFNPFSPKSKPQHEPLTAMKDLFPPEGFGMPKKKRRDKPDP